MLDAGILLVGGEGGGVEEEEEEEEQEGMSGGRGHDVGLESEFGVEK